MSNNLDEGEMEGHKMVLLGDSAVGKTSIVLRFTRGDFHDGTEESTIGAAFLAKVVEFEDRRRIKLAIWDTAGQERYAQLAPMYIRGSKAGIVVYSIDSYASFERAKLCLKQLRKETNPLAVVLAANKADLEDSRQVQRKEAEVFAEEEGCKFFETSAKTWQNVNEIFNFVAKTLLDSGSPAGDGGDEQDNDEASKIRLTDASSDQKEEKKKGGCC